MASILFCFPIINFTFDATIVDATAKINENPVHKDNKFAVNTLTCRSKPTIWDNSAVDHSFDHSRATAGTLTRQQEADQKTCLWLPQGLYWATSGLRSKEYEVFGPKLRLCSLCGWKGRIDGPPTQRHGIAVNVVHKYWPESWNGRYKSSRSILTAIMAETTAEHKKLIKLLIITRLHPRVWLQQVNGTKERNVKEQNMSLKTVLVVAVVDCN